MAVKFNNLEELTIKKNEALSHRRINEILYKLLQNDIDISPLSDFSPKIWECTWYNGSKNIIGQYGYKKGEAVWHNTEKLENFIVKNKDLIYFYAKNNDILKNVIKPFDPYNKDIIELYINIIDGYEYIDNNGNPSKLQRLFDIGEITNDVQIYVSLKDNNTIAPSDDKENKYWKTFIKYNADNNISDHIDMIGKLLFLQHIDKYHYGIKDDDISKEDKDKILNLYLNKNLNNIDESAKQIMRKIDYTKNLNGFDKIIDFSNNTSTKTWYRKWQSGYLELGGIIEIDNANINDFIEINLDKEYNYDLTSESYYGLVDLFDFSNKRYNKSNNLNLLRYTVQITPIIDNYNDNNMLAIEVTEFKNSGFKIKTNVTGEFKFRYYVTGYTNSTLL